MNNITQTIKTLILATILSSGISFAYAWTVPTVAPTGGNTAAPLNTSGVEQTKLGNIISSGNIGANAMAISNAAAGALQVVGGATFGGTLSSGAITATTGTFSGQVKSNNVNVLTAESDPNVSAWAKAASKPSYTQNEIGSGALTATTGAFSGNVGIGTATLGAKLSVMDTISGVTTGLNVSPFYVPSSSVTYCNYTGNLSDWCNGWSRYRPTIVTSPAYGGTELNATDSGGTARNLVLQTGTGNVGIGAGAKNPGYKLQVDGSLYATGATTLASTLYVSGATTLTGGVSGNLSVTGNINAQIGALQQLKLPYVTILPTCDVSNFQRIAIEKTFQGAYVLKYCTYEMVNFVGTYLWKPL